MYKYSSSDGVSSQMAGLSVKDPPNSSQQSTVDSVSHLNLVHFFKQADINQKRCWEGGEVVPLKILIYSLHCI